MSKQLREFQSRKATLVKEARTTVDKTRWRRQGATLPAPDLRP